MLTGVVWFIVTRLAIALLAQTITVYPAALLQVGIRPSFNGAAAAWRYRSP